MPFTDIVGSTERADRPVTGSGATSWTATRVGAASLTSYDGVEFDTAGDGFLATLTGPARVVRCACTSATLSAILAWRSGHPLPQRRARHLAAIRSDLTATATAAAPEPPAEGPIPAPLRVANRFVGACRTTVPVRRNGKWPPIELPCIRRISRGGRSQRL